MKKIHITPPPATIENKPLSIWANSAYNTMKSLIIKIDDMDKKISFLMKKVGK